MNIVVKWFKTNLSNRQVVVLVGFLALAFLILYFFGDMIAPVLAAVVVAFLLDGLVKRLTKRGMPHLLSVIVTFVSFLVGAFLVFFAVLPPIAAQVGNFVTSLPGMIAALNEQASKLPEILPGIVDQAWVDGLMAGLQNEILELGPKVLQFSVSNLAGLIAFVVYAILVPLMVFFFLKDKANIIAWLCSFLPDDRPLADQVWNEVIAKTADYARGKVIEIIIVGFAAWGLFALIGLPYAAFLAFITGISVIIPYIGAALVTLPVAVVAFAEWGLAGNFYLAVGAYLGLQALDGNVLVPWLFSEVVKLHPNAIILAILVFGGLWGFWGVFFAIPLATLAHAIIRAWPRQPPPKKA